jgi:hypothetical protein
MTSLTTSTTFPRSAGTHRARENVSLPEGDRPGALEEGMGVVRTYIRSAEGLSSKKLRFLLQPLAAASLQRQKLAPAADCPTTNVGILRLTHLPPSVAALVFCLFPITLSQERSMLRYI